jgi:hypothetical protein
MEGHETMMINQAFLAVMHAVGTVKAGEVTTITTVCTGSRIMLSSSIVGEATPKDKSPDRKAIPP